MNRAHNRTADRRPAFTLVEVLTVIIIISILAALATVGIGRARQAANTTAIRMEINSLSQAIVRYQEKHGDYPPDFSSWDVVNKHYRKAFPRVSDNDATLLFNMLHSGGVYQAAALDRAEVLVWTLGGYSSNIQRPFTGPGGPLVWVGDGTNEYSDGAVTDLDRQNPANFQINSDRINSFFDFDATRLNYTEIDASSLMTGANRYLSRDDGDLFLTYAARQDGAPYVYFDARTYGHFDPTIADFNGYADPAGNFGVVRPYLSDQAVNNTTGANYVDLPAAMDAWRFVNDDSYQIVSAGLDNLFGSISQFDVNGGGDDPIYFQYPTGKAIALRTDVATPGELVIEEVSGFQEQSYFGAPENGHVDNVTSFSEAKIADDVTDSE